MPVPKPRARILVVDDDEGVLRLIASTLELEGYAVECCATGAAMLESARASAPDLMLLDLTLRDMGGSAMLDRMTAEGVQVPFIVVTGQGDERIAVEIMRRGALDYVTKDTAMLDLLPSVVERALASVGRERALAAEREERLRLEQEILAISESEQRRIGQDLHDGLGQQLTAIEIMCAGLKADAAKQPALAKQVDRIGQLLRESIGQVRSLARGLVPVGEDPDALWASLVELADRTNALGRARCVFESGEVVALDDRTAAGHLYRIAQEAVNNAVKHSRASMITLALRRVPDGLELSIADDGQGRAAQSADGLGLQLMKHRANVIGAVLSVDSRAGAGTTVRCQWRSAP